MRIQETDRILKEARLARSHAAHDHEHDEGSMMSRAWRMVSALPSRLTGMLRKH
jgi:hypothetical protein